MDTQSDHQENRHDAQSPTSNQVFGLSPEQALKPRTNKRKLIIACAALSVLLVGSLTWAFVGRKDAPSQSASQQAPRLGAAITLIDGSAKISQSGGAWTPLSMEIVPQEGDTIATDPASRVIITLDDGSIIRLDESSTVKLASLDQNDIRMDNDLGDVYARVIASERKFTVSVDGTGYTALGTAFKTVNETTNKGVQVLQSSVSVEGLDTKVDEGKQFFKAHAVSDLADKVTDVSVEELKSDGFMIWNLEQDEKEEAFKDKLGYLTKIKEEAAAPTAAPTVAGASIKVTASTNEKGVVLKWTVSGVSGNKGFKVVRSKKTASPTFGKDEANYADGASARSLTWKDGSGITYNYRVCAYYGDSCGTYSNTVTIASPYTPPEPVVSGPVALTMTGNVASWTFGGTAPHGFKVLVGTSSGPTYGNSYKTFYTGDTSKEIEGLDAGTYYVRVCKYTADSSISGGCTDYSDEETLVIP